MWSQMQLKGLGVLSLKAQPSRESDSVIIRELQQCFTGGSKIILKEGPPKLIQYWFSYVRDDISN